VGGDGMWSNHRDDSRTVLNTEGSEALEQIGVAIMECNICRQDHDKQSSKHLAREYLELNKARLDRMFGYNAARCQKVIALVLRGRGFTHIDNIFGPIEIQTE
jgi:hypothetical protein